MDNVFFLRAKDITPEAVAHNVLEEMKTKKYKALYVVGIEKDPINSPTVWASGDLGELCFASQVFNVLAHRFIRGEIEDD